MLLVELHLLYLLKTCILGALPCELTWTAHVSQNSLRTLTGSFMLFCATNAMLTKFIQYCIILKDIKWTKLLWSWYGSCTL